MNVKKGRWLTVGILLVVVWIGPLVTACSVAPTAPPPTPAGVSEAPKPTPKPAVPQRVEDLNVAIATTSGSYMPLYVGIGKGFYTEEKLNVNPVIMKANIATAALLSGSLDFVSPPSLPAASQGAPVRLLMIFQNKPVWSLMAKPEIRSVKDLKGKVVGIPTRGTSPEYVTMKIMQANGLDPIKDVTYVGMGGDPQVRLGALKTGTVAALLETYPSTYLAEAQGSHVLVVSADVLPEWPLGGLSTTMARLKDNPDQVKRMLRATLRGMMWARDNRDETVNILVKALDLDQELGGKTYNDFMKGMPSNGEISDKGLVTEFATLKEFGLFKGDIPSASKLADWTILREVRKELNLAP
ncbi:MAG: ABC transporter substrate-binding protein [Chloroflexi bacterium]|nr:ABC transporter substrate-binding protein [Chloroflexota bacterium]